MRNIEFLFAIVTATIFLMMACVDKSKNDKAGSKEASAHENSTHKRPLAIENGKIFEKSGRKYLWGGEDSSWHFDITESFLEDGQYHYGIGRETFHALIDPEFITREEADEIYPDSARFLLAKKGDDVKAYGIDLLTHHEVVNDSLNGQPIMAAYCILADLGAIYDRIINDRPFTFALTGYTYYDPEVWNGMDGFVLWDRETESTWWPLVGKAVSGPMQGTAMRVYDQKHWAQTTWGEIKSQYAEVKVLKPGQSMEPPVSWPKYNDLIAKSDQSINQGKAIAPKWGENDQLN